jgi:hypothetical protein
VSTLGETLIVVGNLLFLFNVGYAIVRYYRSVCRVAYADLTVSLEPAGVVGAARAGDRRKLAV